MNGEILADIVHQVMTYAGFLELTLEFKKGFLYVLIDGDKNGLNPKMYVEIHVYNDRGNVKDVFLGERDACFNYKTRSREVQRHEFFQEIEALLN